MGGDDLFRVYFGGADAVVGTALISVKLAPLSGKFRCERAGGTGLSECVPDDSGVGFAACNASCGPPPPPHYPMTAGKLYLDTDISGDNQGSDRTVKTWQDCEAACAKSTKGCVAFTFDNRTSCPEGACCWFKGPDPKPAASPGRLSMLLKKPVTTLKTDAAVAFEARLASDVADVGVEFGLVVNHANTLERDPTLAPPPGNYSRGSMIVAAFPSLDPTLPPNTHEVYVTNSTGNIPLAYKHEHEQAAAGGALEGGGGGMCLYRWTTADFRSYQGGACALWLPSDGLGDVKTITRDDATGTYYLIWWGPGQRTNGGSPDLSAALQGGGSPYL